MISTRDQNRAVTADAISARTVWLGLLLVMLATAVAYKPGLDGPFMFDDYGSIRNNSAIRMETLSAASVLEAARSSHLGAKFFHRPMARVSFALNYYFSGRSYAKFDYKATNLGIHLVNGLLVFILTTLLVSRMMTSSSPLAVSSGSRPGIWGWLPLLTTAFWLLHPIQLNSVLYVVQRMTSLAAFGVLLGVIAYVVGRNMYDNARRAKGVAVMVMGVSLGSFVGVMSKENAVLTPLFACLVEFFFFERRALSGKHKRILKWCIASVVVVCAVGTLSIAFMRYEVLVNFYDVRNFTLLERVLTQPRVLFFYLGLLFFPSPSRFGLFHDDIVLSHGLLDPWTTIVALLALLAIMGFCIWGVRKRNLLAFGLAWYLVGHSIESGVIGLELIHEHRNYVPSFGISFASAYLLIWSMERVRIRAVIAMATAAVVGVFMFNTYTRSLIWESGDSLHYFAVQTNPDSYRVQMGYAGQLQQNDGDIEEIYRAYQTAATLNPYNVLPVVRMQRIISGIIHQFDEGSLRPDEFEVMPALADSYDDPLVFLPEHARALDQKISEEITFRLTNYAIDAETAVALNELRRCVGSWFSTCPSAEQIEDWVLLTLDRHHRVPEQTAALMVTLARLRTYDRDLDSAVGYMESAFEQTPSEVGLLIELALMYVDFNELEAAWSTTERARVLVESSGRRASDYWRLHEFLQERFEELSLQPDGTEVGESPSTSNDNSE